MPATSSQFDRLKPAECPANRILFLVHRVPYPPDKGDRIASYRMLTKLAEIGRVDLAFLADEPIDRETEATLGRICHRVEAVPVSKLGRWVRAALSLARGRSFTEGLFDAPRMHAVVGRWLSDTPYHLVVCFSSGVLPYVRGHGLESRLIADMVDVDSQKWFNYADQAGGLKAALFRLEGRRVRALERSAARSRAVIFVSEQEANLYRRDNPDARVDVVTNGVDLDYFQPPVASDERGGCLFVGQLDYRANVLGLEAFCRDSWPMIRSAVPDATLTIVGRNPVPAVRRLGLLAGVKLVGPVPDVRPYLASARLVVVPLLVARGIQNKVLEAMAMGRAVVASPAALEGIPLVEGRDAIAASTPSDWVRCIAQLWADSARRDELGRNARRYVEANHRWETCLERVDALIDSATEV